MTFGISEAHNCTGKTITLKNGWTLEEDPMYCAPKAKDQTYSAPKAKAVKQKKSSHTEFINHVMDNLCLDSQDVEDFQKEFHYDQYDISITVKGRCNNGEKHGNFVFFENEKRLFGIKFINNEVVKTSCTIKKNISDFMDCFLYTLKSYEVLYTLN